MMRALALDNRHEICFDGIQTGQFGCTSSKLAII